MEECDEKDTYVTKLKEVFDSCDTTGSGCLNVAELQVLCEKLHLSEHAETLKHHLFGNATEVKFKDFKECFVAVLTQSIPNEDMMEENIEDDTADREVSPKFTLGHKKYGRRSRPASIVDDDNSITSPLLSPQTSVDHSVFSDNDSKTENIQAKRRSSPGTEQQPPLKSGRMSNDSPDDLLEGCSSLQLTTDSDIDMTPSFESNPVQYLQDTWKKLNIGQSGYLNVEELALVCEHIGMDMTEEVVAQLFEKLDCDQDGQISFDEFLQGLFQHGDPQSCDSSVTKVENSKSLYNDGSRDDRQITNTSISGIFSCIDPNNTGYADVSTILELWESLEVPCTPQLLEHHGPPLSSAPHYPTAPRGLRLDPSYDETAIAIIAPDIRVPQNNPLSISTLEYCEQYSPLGCLDILLSIVGYVGDLGSDLVVCYVLLAEKRVLWAALTATFVLLSVIVINVLSIYWYIRNQRSSASIYTSVSKTTWVVRTLFHVFCIGLLYRYIHMLCKCLCKERLEDREHRSVMEARKRKNAILQMTIKDDKQTATLCLLHSFLESAPQLILQLYTLAQRTDEDRQAIIFIQGACAASSLFQLALSITSYNSTLHRTMMGKKKPNNIGKVLQFLWHFCTIGSRACTLALFTKEYHFWLFPFCIGHWGIMTIWVMHQQTRFCRKNGELHQCKEYMCNMVVGVAYVIYYLNVKAEPTRYKYSAYYAIVFAENCTLMTLWFLRNDPGVWYHIPALVAVFSSFASGIVFMLFYYGFCHRTLKQTNEKRAAHCC